MYVTSIAISGTSLFSGIYDAGIYTYSGTTWVPQDSGLTNLNVVSVTSAPNGSGGTNLFAGTSGGGVFLSTNNGKYWTAVNNGLTNSYIQTLAFSQNTSGGINIFTGTSGGGVFLSTNNGTSWTAVNSGLAVDTVRSLAVSSTNIFAGTRGGVFLTTNNGASWTAVNDGLTSSYGSYVTSLYVSGSNLFAGTYDGVWVRPLSEMITAVKEKQNNLPVNFSLSQNFPNPFNPSTMINYSVPKTSLVTIKVYDVLGKEKATLVNEEKSAGNYSVSFSANSGLASGIYFCRMQAGSFVDTKKLLLLK